MIFSPQLCFPALFPSGADPARNAQESTAIEIRDLEDQIVEQPAVVPRPLLSKIFSCFYPRVKKRHSLPVSDHQWSEYSHYQHETPQIFVANGTDSAVTNDGKVTSHKSLSLRSDQSGTLTVDETDSTAITEVDGNIASNESLSTASTVSLTDDVTGESTQHVIIPPPKVHTAISSNTVELLEFESVKSPGLAPSRSCFHEVSSWEADQGQNHSGEHLILWDIFQGPSAPKSLSAKERLKARCTRPTEFSEIESARLAVPYSHGLDHDAEAPFVPAREGWARYHRCT